GALSYEWDNGVGAVEDPTGLSAATYTLTITDANNCTFTETIMVEEPPAIELSMAEAIGASCNGAADGAIEVSASGGTGALSYAWDNGIGVVEDPAGLPAGAYTLTITDENSCTLTEAVTVTEPPAIDITQLETQGASCNGAADGSVAISASGGTGTLSYEWDNGIGAIE
ncbi:MAG: SprB repeat-containing protein, partial [Phaeodactylibacter sp.]|nr:SprB repeat-containing protein [Phaeodactylibacter sp.]